jgi:hypothetical protein
MAFRPPSLTAKLWKVNEHLGRRNFTDEQLSYWIGMQFEMEKQSHGGQQPGIPQSEVSSGKNAKKAKGAKKTKSTKTTADRVAKQHKVSRATVERDAKFARAMNVIASAVESR